MAESQNKWIYLCSIAVCICVVTCTLCLFYLKFSDITEPMRETSSASTRVHVPRNATSLNSWLYKEYRVVEKIRDEDESMILSSLPAKIEDGLILDDTYITTLKFDDSNIRYNVSVDLNEYTVTVKDTRDISIAGIKIITSGGYSVNDVEFALSCNDLTGIYKVTTYKENSTYGITNSEGVYGEVDVKKRTIEWSDLVE